MRVNYNYVIILGVIVFYENKKIWGELLMSISVRIELLDVSDGRIYIYIWIVGVWGCDYLYNGR